MLVAQLPVALGLLERGDVRALAVLDERGRPCPSPPRGSWRPRRSCRRGSAGVLRRAPTLQAPWGAGARGRARSVPSGRSTPRALPGHRRSCAGFSGFRAVRRAGRRGSRPARPPCAACACSSSQLRRSTSRPPSAQARRGSGPPLRQLKRGPVVTSLVTPTPRRGGGSAGRRLARRPCRRGRCGRCRSTRY